MDWKKLGLIFDISKQSIPWLKSHAMMPLTIELPNVIRVYYTGRHIDGRSRVSFFDLSKDDLTKVVYVHDQPILEVGEIGTFDDCGTVGTFVMKEKEEILLYYNGYNVRNTVPWSNSIGIAKSKDDGLTFSKLFKGPIMDRNTIDPFFSITPCIVRENETWHMWYTSGTGWVDVDGRKEPLYDIKYASSLDGINWIRKGEICISQNNTEECVARATVVAEGNTLHMWFIYRGSRDFRDGNDSYKIGYAKGSITNPTQWVREDDNCNLEPSLENIDDKMQAYPCVILQNGKLIMFYNGNGFGMNGICCAVSESL